MLWRRTQICHLGISRSLLIFYYLDFKYLRKNDALFLISNKFFNGWNTFSVKNGIINGWRVWHRGGASQYTVCYTAVFSVVTQRSSPQYRTLWNTSFRLRDGFTTVANCFKTEVKWRELSSFVVSVVYYGALPAQLRNDKKGSGDIDPYPPPPPPPPPPPQPQ